MPAGPVGPPMWLTLLEDEEDEEEEELGRPPKLILMLGRRALSPSCHSFTFKPSIELLFSAGGDRDTITFCPQQKSIHTNQNSHLSVKQKCLRVVRLNVSSNATHLIPVFTCTTRMQTR